MSENRVGNQKRAKRESLIRKELSKLFLSIKISDPELEDLYINSIELSIDKGSAYVLFFSMKGEDNFNEKLSHLILYKPSMRKALSQILDSRYTPQIVFRYDKMMEKQAKIVDLLDKVKAEEENLYSNKDDSSSDTYDCDTCDNCDSCDNCDQDEVKNGKENSDNSHTCELDCNSSDTCDKNNFYKNAVCANDSEGFSPKE